MKKHDGGVNYQCEMAWNRGNQFGFVNGVLVTLMAVLIIKLIT